MRSITLRIVFLLSVTALSISIIVFVIYFQHFAWKATEWRLGLNGTKGLQYSDCIATTIPEDWEEIAFGSVQISLPKELADTMATIERSETTVRLRLRSFTIIITDTSATRPFGAISEAFTALNPRSRALTQPRIRFECFRRSSSDFSWAMSANDVRQHAFLIIWGQIGRDRFDKIEKSFGPDIDKIILFGDDEVAIDFHSLDQSVEGHVLLQDEVAKVDHDLARRVCQSIKVYSRREETRKRN